MAPLESVEDVDLEFVEDVDLSGLGTDATANDECSSSDAFRFGVSYVFVLGVVGGAARALMLPVRG